MRKKKKNVLRKAIQEAEKAEKVEKIEKAKTLEKMDKASQTPEEKKMGASPKEKTGDIDIDRATETEAHKEPNKNTKPKEKTTRTRTRRMPTTQQKKKVGTRRTTPTNKKTKKRKKKDITDEFINQIEDIATSGKNAEKLIKMVPTVVEDVIKMAGKEPLRFLIFYNKLLKVVGTNIPGLLSNLQKINEDIPPEVTYVVVGEGLKKALFSLPTFALSAISHPLKTVNMAISAALHTVIFLIGSIQGVMQAMMEEETKKAMSSVGRSRRGYG